MAFPPIVGRRLQEGIGEPALSALEVVRCYHQRSKHYPGRYAAGPETLDWDSQPNPFRHFEGATTIELPLSARNFPASPSALFGIPGSPVPPTLESLGAFFEMSLAINAWKSHGPDRWALRCSPSSGNLHPTEGYLIALGMDQVRDGLYHYDAEYHVLEQRAILTPKAANVPCILIGLTTIHWREAWKYGERAFRYCHLDLGHIIESLSAAARSLGWSLCSVPLSHTTKLSAILGTDRAEDFQDAETEAPQLLLKVLTSPQPASDASLPAFNFSEWAGRANRLDPQPFYEWPAIEEVSFATEFSDMPAFLMPWSSSRKIKDVPLPSLMAAELIWKRRSAQAFDQTSLMSESCFQHLLTLTFDREHSLARLGSSSPGIYPLLWIHRVERFNAGLYLVTMDSTPPDALRSALDPDFKWRKHACASSSLKLWHLRSLDNPRMAKAIHCHQAIASNAMLVASCLIDFGTLEKEGAWHYRRLHWESGALGHRLYLASEALGLRTTGIGCFFDDEYHAVLGLHGARYQTLYQLAIGQPLVDERIRTFPAYPKRG